METLPAKSGSLMKRVAVAVVFIPLLVWIFWVQGIALFFFLAAITLLGQWELFRMSSEKLRISHRSIGYVAGFALIADGFFGDSAHLAVIVVSALILYNIIEIVSGNNNKLERISLSLLMTVYPALFVSFLFKIEQIGSVIFTGSSRKILLIVLLIIWLFDTASYFSGRFFGKHPFFPGISPKKTIEGFFGGLLCVLVFGIILGFTGDVSFSGHYLAIAVLTALAGQAGDLSESLLKREFKIKDSSNILPGHGGILDRFDSLFFAGPVVYLYCYLFLVLYK